MVFRQARVPDQAIDEAGEGLALAGRPAFRRSREGGREARREAEEFPEAGAGLGPQVGAGLGRGREEVGARGFRRLEEDVDARLADPARGLVDHALEGDLVAGIAI